MKREEFVDGRCWRASRLAIIFVAVVLVAFAVLQLAAPSAHAITYYTRYQQSDSRISYAGTWYRYPAVGYNWSYSGGSYKYSSSSGASVTIPFRGTGIYWVAKKGPGQGSALVSVDGGTPVYVSLYNSWNQYHLKVWGRTGLTNGLHFLKIKRNNGTINIDAADVAGTLASSTRYQQNDWHLLYYPYNVSYAPNWTPVYSALASGGSYRYHTYHALVRIQFNGTKLDYVAMTKPTMGKVQIFLDGVSKGIVNLYNPTSKSKKVWSTGFLRPGVHEVEVDWYNGNLSIDAVDIIGTIQVTDEAAVRAVVAAAVRSVIGSTTPFNPMTIIVNPIEGNWAAANFPGPPGYEGGFCVLHRTSGTWHFVFGIENMWWGSAAELTAALTLAGVPASFAAEVASNPTWVP